MPHATVPPVFLRHGAAHGSSSSEKNRTLSPSNKKGTGKGKGCSAGVPIKVPPCNLNGKAFATQVPPRRVQENGITTIQ